MPYRFCPSRKGNPQVNELVCQARIEQGKCKQYDQDCEEVVEQNLSDAERKKRSTRMKNLNKKREQAVKDDAWVNRAEDNPNMSKRG